jgi:cyclic pyranopterin phosphate synthase
MAEQMTFLPKKELLTLEEIADVCDSFIELGTKKIRLTGGEPLVRRNIMHLINHLGAQVENQNLEEVTITTNGSQLHKYAVPLFDAGVRRINVSIDTLQPEKFTQITRWGKLDVVLEGLVAAKKAGLKIKLNTVALKGVNDNELASMLIWAGEQGFDMTIIEVMPMGDIGS